MATKKKVTEEVKDTAEKVADKATAEKIEAKKTVHSAAKQTKEKAATTKAKTEAKKADAKEVKAAVAAEAKDAKKIEATKKTRATGQKVKEAVAPAVEAVKKPIAKAKAGKVNLVFQSVMGGAVTPEEITAKLPKEATDAYIKIEENKIYWVGKKGEMGSVDIWD